MGPSCTRQVCRDQAWLRLAMLSRCCHRTQGLVPVTAGLCRWAVAATLASTPRTLGPPLPTPSPTPWMQASAPASPASSSLPLCLRQVVSLLVPLFQVEVPILLSGPSGPPQHGCRSGLGAVAQHGQRESVLSCFHDVVRSEARQCSACQCSACWHQRSHVLLLPVVSTAGYAFPDLGGITHQTLGGFMACGSAGGSLEYSFQDALQSFTFVDGNGEEQTCAV
jgi:hypothetical protein